MSSGVTSLRLCPGQFTQSGLCRSGAELLWAVPWEDPHLPQARRGVARRHCAYPLAEPSHGGEQPSRVSEEFSVKFCGEQLDEGNFCQPHSTYGSGDLSPSLSWSPLSPPTKWRWGRCGVTQTLLQALTPICACSPA